MHAHTYTHARLFIIIHAKKAKNAKFIRITCFFYMRITVGLSHIVTLISIFLPFRLNFSCCCCCCRTFVRCAKRAQTININNVLCMHNKNIHWTNTKKVIFHKHTNKHAFERRQQKNRIYYTSSTEQQRVTEIEII